MRCVLLVAAVAVVAAAPGGGDNDPLIVHRPGLWTSTVTAPGVPTKVLRTCFDPDYDRQAERERFSRRMAGCGEAAIERRPDGFSARSTCRVTTGTVTVLSTVTRTDGRVEGAMASFRMTVHSTLDPAPPPLAEGTTVTLDERWVGSCPADIAPGTTVDEAGHRIARPGG